MQHLGDNPENATSSYLLVVFL